MSHEASDAEMLAWEAAVTDEELRRLSVTWKAPARAKALERRYGKVAILSTANLARIIRPAIEAMRLGDARE